MASKPKTAKAKPVRRSREELLAEAKARVAKLENADREKDLKRQVVLVEQMNKLTARIGDLQSKHDTVREELEKISDRLGES